MISIMPWLILLQDIARLFVAQNRFFGRRNPNAGLSKDRIGIPVVLLAAQLRIVFAPTDRLCRRSTKNGMSSNVFAGEDVALQISWSGGNPFVEGKLLVFYPFQMHSRG